VALNCAALPETLVEAELFGMEKGVATGVDRRAGKFEAANGGTLFLDEIGDLSLTAQAKILRVLQDRAVERVGGRKEIPIDVRLVAATNKDLEKLIGKGEFREDLYYRLNVVRLRTPALREIASDIPAIACALLDRAAREMQRPVPDLEPEALALLAAHRWPGNVRQLENEMRRAVALARGGVVRAEDLSAEVRGESPAPAEAPRKERLPLADAVEQLERERIRESLVRCRYNQLRTAKDLGLSRQGLLNKLKRYGIAARPEEEQEA
jgi:transcriptional regulator with PAS, ATPase and Fis domain